MIIELESGLKFKFEKNHLPEISYDVNIDVNMQTMEVNPKNKDFGTFNIFIGNAEVLAGGDNLWVYDAISQNCQYFVRDCINGANALTPEIVKFVMQDS